MALFRPVAAMTTLVERTKATDVPAHLGLGQEIPERRDIKRGASIRVARDGDAPIIRAPKPVVAVGRFKTQRYCPTCGRKRKACSGHGAALREEERADGR